ncbi:LCP family protein [Streptococcus sp. S784/96/1]|uniref:LCP family protein n=1 Tax=Streptococcus sp. S784/96/1 TaxID=2653499 RepID=UPI00138A6307|nr:LCP family protein [Streptococcus sp. S784/96/1]
MPDRRLEALTHHEALRYDYLSKNIHFLNPKEKAELEHLKAKLAGELVSYSQERNLSQDALNALPVYPKRENSKRYSRKEKHGDLDLPPYPNGMATAFDKEQPKERIKGLPAYPTQERSKKVSRPKIHKRVEQPVKEQSIKVKSPKPAKKKRNFSFKRFLKWIGIVILAVLTGMIVMFVKGMNEITSGKNNYQPAQVEVFNGEDTLDGTNILILGSDKRVTQNSTDARTDTIMVMNIGGSDGKIKLASFMRDTLVNIPGYSSDDYSTDLKLNSSFTFGEQDGDQGAEFVRLVLKHNFDIDIKYYVMIDFETFAIAIDTLFPEGVEIDAAFETVGGETVTEVEVPDDLGYAQGGAMYQTIAVGKQRMDGKTLLNYARFRGDDTADFGRVKRQQQVLEAVFAQVKNPAKLFTGSAAVGKIYALTSTNVSYPVLLAEGVGILTSGRGGIERLTIPQQGDWIDTYDMYGGMGLDIDRDNYKELLAQMGLR